MVSSINLSALSAETPFARTISLIRSCFALLEHLFFAGGELFPENPLGRRLLTASRNFSEITGFQFFHIITVSFIPVIRHRSGLRLQYLCYFGERLRFYDITNSYLSGGFYRYHHLHIAVRQPEYIVTSRLAGESSVLQSLRSPRLRAWDTQLYRQ